MEILQELGEKYGPIDLSMINIEHMILDLCLKNQFIILLEEALNIAQDLKSKKF